MKKNFLFNALCAMVACAGLAACEKDENPSGNGGNDGGGTDTPSEYTLIANPLSLSFGWNSTSPQTITVTTNAPAFTVGEHPSWYTAVASGNTVVVTPTENDGEARSHELTISAEGAAPVKIRISQDEKGEIHSSLQGSEYIVWQLDASSTSYLGTKVILSLAENATNKFFYIWPNGDSLVADESASGANFYGNMDGYMALKVGSVGWSGGGYVFSTNEGAVEDELTPAMEKIMADGGKDWYFHAAVKGTPNEGSNFLLDTKAGGTAYEVRWDAKGITESEWVEIEIPMTDIIGAGWTGFATDTNNLCVRSSGKAGVRVHYDAVFIYKK